MLNMFTQHDSAALAIRAAMQKKTFLALTLHQSCVEYNMLKN